VVTLVKNFLIDDIFDINGSSKAKAIAVGRLYQAFEDVTNIKGIKSKTFRAIREFFC